MSTINYAPNCRLCLTVLCALALVATSPAAAQDGQLSPEEIMALLEGARTEDFVPGEVIVKLKDDAPPTEGRLATMAAGMAADEQRTSGGEIIFRVGPSSARTMSDDDLRAQTLAAVESMRQDPGVEYAQPNYIYHIVRTPNDSSYPQQWHYFDNGTGSGQSPGGINLPTRWDTSTGSSSVVVAVIDTGILPGHSDIAGSPNLVAGFDMISNPFIANDGGGRDADPTDPGDAVTAGECSSGSPARPNSWHGTHVAGTVGVGHTDNSAGVAGVNWQVKVQAVRVLGKCGGMTTDINDAIRWAAGLPVPGVTNNATPANVINMSLGGSGACSASPSQQAAIDDAVAMGVTVVVAAGNNARDASMDRPASCNNVITVAAADARGRLVRRYSNYGAMVEIMAPGGDVNRDDNGDGNPDGVLSMVQGGYAYYNGTSMAAPHVAGVAALMLAADSTLTPARILARLQANALPRTSTDCPKACGAGLLNAVEGPATPLITLRPSSVNLDKDDPPVILTATVADGDGSPLPGVAVNFSSTDPTVATVAPAAGITDASGQATLTLTPVKAGKTEVRATAAGVTAAATARVEVTPTAALWALALLAAITWLLLGRRARGSR